MKSHYKRLGDYIREVNIRNRDLEVTELLGLSVSKEFIPSIANTIGTDMSTYKIVANRQFVYIADTSRRGDKIAIALLHKPKAIVSQAYTVFEIINKDELLPEYLMMWFRRPEFDRYARFKSHGSAREIFDWSEMCSILLPVPAIEIQRKIVAEYETLSHRITINEQICNKLVNTAQTLYRKMFIDDIDPENLPTGWRIGTIGELFELQRGFDLPSQNRVNGQYPIYASTGITSFHNNYMVKAPGIVTGRSGSIGEVFFVDVDFWPLNTTLWVKDFKNSTPFYVYHKLLELELSKRCSGSVVLTLNRNDVHSIVSTVPPHNTILKFETSAAALYKTVKTIKTDISLTKILLSLLLSKLATN